MRFLMMDYSILQDKALTEGEKIVYCYCLSYINHTPTMVCIVPTSTFASDLGMSSRNVVRLLASLEKKGYIKITYCLPKGIRTNRIIELARYVPNVVDTYEEPLRDQFARVYNNLGKPKKERIDPFKDLK